MLMLMLYYVVYRDIYCDDGMECLVGKSRFSLFLSLAVRIALSLPRGSARHWASVTSVIFTRVCSCVRDCSFLECPCSQYCVCDSLFMSGPNFYEKFHFILFNFTGILSSKYIR